MMAAINDMARLIEQLQREKESLQIENKRIAELLAKLAEVHVNTRSWSYDTDDSPRSHLRLIRAITSTEFNDCGYCGLPVMGKTCEEDTGEMCDGEIAFAKNYQAEQIFNAEMAEQANQPDSNEQE